MHGFARLHRVIDAIRELENLNPIERNAVFKEINDLATIAKEGGYHTRGELLDSLLKYLEY